MASRAHAVVDIFLCACIGAGIGASVTLTVVSGDLDWCCRGWYNGGAKACAFKGYCCPGST
eukprot:5715650-Pleurochrysis_carterae.AAC.1